ENRVQTGLAHGPHEWVRLFNGEIARKYAIKTGLYRVCRQPFETIVQQRIEIAEQHQRNPRLLPDILAQRQNLRNRDTVLQSPLGRTLNHRPIGNRVGERHSQFDHIRPCLLQRKVELESDLQARISGRQIRDKCLCIVTLELDEALFNSCHVLSAANDAKSANSVRALGAIRGYEFINPITSFTSWS